MSKKRERLQREAEKRMRELEMIANSLRGLDDMRHNVAEALDIIRSELVALRAGL